MNWAIQFSIVLGNIVDIDLGISEVEKIEKILNKIPL